MSICEIRLNILNIKTQDKHLHVLATHIGPFSSWFTVSSLWSLGTLKIQIKGH